MPASLLHHDRFSRIYRGDTTEEMTAGLDAETDLVRLPQIVHAASCAAFHPSMQQVCDEERCAVAHGFDAAPYTEPNEMVWIAAEIESKLEIGARAHRSLARPFDAGGARLRLQSRAAVARLARRLFRPRPASYLNDARGVRFEPRAARVTHGATRHESCGRATAAAERTTSSRW